MALQSLQDLYLEQLRDLYSAERQILDALPKMIETAAHDELRDGFSRHRQQTQQHVQRLEQIAKQLGQDLDGVTCKGMKGLLEEGDEIMKKRADADVLDAALIAAAQRVEHYEIAGYGCARTYAHALGRSDDVSLLQQTLDEEAQTDKTLTQIAEQVVNPAAQAAGASRTREAGTSREARL